MVVTGDICSNVGMTAIVVGGVAMVVTGDIRSNLCVTAVVGIVVVPWAVDGVAMVVKGDMRNNVGVSVEIPEFCTCPSDG